MEHLRSGLDASFFGRRGGGCMMVESISRLLTETSDAGSSPHVAKNFFCCCSSVPSSGPQLMGRCRASRECEGPSYQDSLDSSQEVSEETS